MSLLTLLAATVAAASTPAFSERPCADARLAGLARCGTVRVPEDRAASAGRAIDLNIMILPAAATTPDLPPLFDIDGGPGLPATKNAEFYLTAGGAYRARRAVVLVDQRGTGASSPLNCPGLSASEDAYREMLPPAAVAVCRAALAAGADLTRYGTREAVADLDAVRAALGHDRIDIFALSYGTTVALRYLATHPGRVRAAVLMGTAPADAMPPRHHAPAGERALDLLFEDCAADPACRAAFPSPATDLDRAVAGLASVAGAPSPAIFMEKLRSLMYAPLGARRVPWILHRAAQGDLEPFYAATRPQGPSLLSDGMFLSVTCAEGLALLDYDAAAAARATRFGDYRLRRQREACALWPRAEVAPDHLAPVETDAAVLFVSGRLDPVTPPDWADQAARRMPHARHIVIPQGGHILGGLSGADTCFDPVILRFYDTADAAALDAACLAEMKAPPFATEDR
ncbi:alpha/beta hydrolase [Enterovirga sp. GCM10030262]|uniref:alpha/beta hydrolase n=1 Tax=Enterovirga sp. GCM10030262 TaxID=3273391 RepID=UPI003622FA2B